MTPLLRLLLLALGWLSLGLGVIGIFLPLLPTTPFLLLAAALFMRASDRLYAWLTGHAVLGPYIRDYLEGRGIPLKAKLLALGMMWTSLLFTALVLTDKTSVRVILPVTGLAVSLWLWRQPTRRADDGTDA